MQFFPSTRWMAGRGSGIFPDRKGSMNGPVSGQFDSSDNSGSRRSGSAVRAFLSPDGPSFARVIQYRRWFFCMRMIFSFSVNSAFCLLFFAGGFLRAGTAAGAASFSVSSVSGA